MSKSDKHAAASPFAEAVLRRAEENRPVRQQPATGNRSGVVFIVVIFFIALALEGAFALGYYRGNIDATHVDDPISDETTAPDLGNTGGGSSGSGSDDGVEYALATADKSHLWDEDGYRLTADPSLAIKGLPFGIHLKACEIYQVTVNYDTNQVLGLTAVSKQTKAYCDPKQLIPSWIQGNDKAPGPPPKAPSPDSGTNHNA